MSAKSRRARTVVLTSFVQSICDTIGEKLELGSGRHGEPVSGFSGPVSLVASPEMMWSWWYSRRYVEAEIDMLKTAANLHGSRT